MDIEKDGTIKAFVEKPQPEDDVKHLVMPKNICAEFNVTQSEPMFMASMGIYVFIGWSMGALIAYEMAVQLQETEKSTSEVIILDQQAPVLTFDQHETPKTHIERLAIFAEKVEHLIGLKINISKIELQNLSPLEQSELFLSEFKDKNMLLDYMISVKNEHSTRLNTNFLKFSSYNRQFNRQSILLLHDIKFNTKQIFRSCL